MGKLLKGTAIITGIAAAALVALTIIFGEGEPEGGWPNGYMLSAIGADNWINQPTYKPYPGD